MPPSFPGRPIFVQLPPGQRVVRPRQAALQGRLHLGGSPVQTGDMQSLWDGDRVEMQQALHEGLRTGQSIILM